MAHLHQDESDDRDQQESSETEQKYAVHSEHRGRKHHEKRQHRQHEMVARSLQREQANHHAEQNQVDSCHQEAARHEKIVREVNGDVKQREVGGPALRNRKLLMRDQVVATDDEGATHNNDRQQIQAAGRGQRAKAGEHQQIERYVEVTLNRHGHGDAVRVGSSFKHRNLYCWRKRRGREVSAVMRLSGLLSAIICLAP